MTCWIIGDHARRVERGATRRLYWRAAPGETSSWTDPEMATRFARREDAETVLEHLGLPPRCRASEWDFEGASHPFSPLETAAGVARRPPVRVCAWTKASEREIASGLLAYVAIQFGDVVLDGLTARQTRGGRRTVSYPCRLGRSGRRHVFVRPLDGLAHRRIEDAVLAHGGAS